MITLDSRSPRQTRAIGKKIAKVCAGGEVFFLSGDLGAGKTCLTQGIAAGLGIREPLTSPTFVTHQQYRIDDARTLEHFDFYRLTAGGDEFRDFFNAPHCVCVIEWAEQLPRILPTEFVRIEIAAKSLTSREIVMRAATATGEKWLARFADAVRLPTRTPRKKTGVERKTKRKAGRDV